MIEGVSIHCQTGEREKRREKKEEESATVELFFCCAFSSETDVITDAERI